MRNKQNFEWCQLATLTNYKNVGFIDSVSELWVGFESSYSIFIRSISSFWLNSKILTTADEPGDVSTELCGFHKPDGSVEVDIAANFLKLARIRVLNCANADQQSKKFIDALVKVVLDECYALPEEIDCYSCTFVFQSSCSVSLLLALELYSICDILLAQLNSDSGPSPTWTSATKRYSFVAFGNLVIFLNAVDFILLFICCCLKWNQLTCNYIISCATLLYFPTKSSW